RRRRLLAYLVVRGHVLARIWIEDWFGARIGPHDLRGGIDNLEANGTAGILREVVVDQRTGRRAFAGGELGRPRRRFVHAKAYPHRRRRLEQVGFALRERGLFGGGLAQRRHIVANPEAAPAPSGNQIAAPPPR